MTESTSKPPDTGLVPMPLTKIYCRCTKPIDGSAVLVSAIEQGTGPGANVYACQGCARSMTAWVGAPEWIRELVFGGAG